MLTINTKDGAVPELPEVETIRAGIADHAVDKTITDVVGADSRLFRNNPRGLATLTDELPGLTISAVQRRGKVMWLTFNDIPDVLVVHLGMSGQVHVAQEDTGERALKKHEHARIILDGGYTLSFIDPRMFGHLTLSQTVVDEGGRTIPAVIGHIALDPFEKADLSPIAVRFSRTRRAVKTVLLDQEMVSGIGNIYADEALHAAKIHGSTPAKDLTAGEAEKILKAAREVMARALKAGGTSFDQYYVDTEGNPGYFERALTVYGRHGKACRECGQTIVRTTLSGRSHFFCPQCQRPRF